MTYRLYLRVSTVEQAESGHGLNAQLDACVKYVTGKGGQYVTYEDAGVSGAAPIDERAGFLRLISEVERGDTIVVAKRDRLGRDPFIIAMIERGAQKDGYSIVSVAGEGTHGDGPADVLMRRIIDAFAEYERLIIRGRVKSALAAKKKRGERVGSIPYGYALSSDGKHLEPVDFEQEVISFASSLKDKGLTATMIAHELTYTGVMSRNGKPFHHEQVKRMVSAC